MASVPRIVVIATIGIAIASALGQRLHPTTAPQWSSSAAPMCAAGIVSDIHRRRHRSGISVAARASLATTVACRRTSTLAVATATATTAAAAVAATTQPAA